MEDQALKQNTLYCLNVKCLIVLTVCRTDLMGVFLHIMHPSSFAYSKSTFKGGRTY